MKNRRSSKAADGISHPLPLADFVKALRDELKIARKSADPDFPIEVGPVTVEFTLLTRNEVEGGSGVKFWVVDAGVSGKRSNESTQKVTIELTPLDKEGRHSQIGDVEQSVSTAQLPQQPQN